ncbi:MAG: hypothetical protein M1817_005397 [Caeruleum heppii]|nr:MAG: hypothetical protein M1817_005397 [Caeruleum heppii]
MSSSRDIGQDQSHASQTPITERKQNSSTSASKASSKLPIRHSSADDHQSPKAQTSGVIGSRVAKPRMGARRSSRSNPTTPSKTPAIAPAGLVIRIFINNRLGSKKEILCSPSDTIGDFKKLAAMQLGTRPEAMLLKRQGVRALKDDLTLEDYEIGNGSSLDYEMDTGD